MWYMNGECVISLLHIHTWHINPGAVRYDAVWYKGSKRDNFQENRYMNWIIVFKTCAKHMPLVTSKRKTVLCAAKWFSCYPKKKKEEREIFRQKAIYLMIRSFNVFAWLINFHRYRCSIIEYLQYSYTLMHHTLSLHLVAKSLLYSTLLHINSTNHSLHVPIQCVFKSKMLCGCMSLEDTSFIIIHMQTSILASLLYACITKVISRTLYIKPKCVINHLNTISMIIIRIRFSSASDFTNCRWFV